MKVSLNKKDNSNGEIVLNVEKSDYQDKVEKSLTQFRNKANIPGFRQGKVPKGVIQKMYGKSVLVEELNKLVSEELYNYIRENDLQILGEPLPSDSDSIEIDFDKDDEFEFKFDIALAPEFELALSENDELIYHKVDLEDDLMQKQLESYKANYGAYKSIEEPSVDTDLLKGSLTEFENGEPKADANIIDNAILMPSYVKDEETKNNFIGVNVGDKVVFNPRKAYDNHEAEIASLLQSTKELVKDINSDFSFEIKEITRYEEAEMNQDLFDKILGEGVATSEEEFKAKVRESLNEQHMPNSDYLFMRNVRELFLEKTKDVKFPEEFLKRWLLLSDDKKTPESVEEEYPRLIEDLKFYITKEKIVKEQDIKIENEEIEALAIEVAKAQFAQYGMSNVPEESLKGYVKSMLENEDSLRNLYDRLTERKLIEWLRNTIKVTDKTVTSTELNDMLKDEEVAEEEVAD